MIRVFCDLCKRETLGIGMLGSNYQQRVTLPHLNVCFNLEFPVDGRPEHVCLICAAEQLERAVKKLREPSSLHAE